MRTGTCRVYPSPESEANLANQIVKRVKRWVELTSSELFLDDVLSDRSATPDSSTSSTSSMSWDDIETDTAGSLPSRASSRSSLFEFVDE